MGAPNRAAVEADIEAVKRFAEAWRTRTTAYANSVKPQTLSVARVPDGRHVSLTESQLSTALAELERLTAEATGGEQAQDGAAPKMPPPFVTALTDKVLATMQPAIAMSVRHLLASRSVWRVQAYRNSAERDAATARAEAAEAELGRVNRRTDSLDDALKGLRQQAIEAVKERNEAIARAEKAEAERRIATALSNRRKVERNQARALMYSIIGAIECAYALNTYVELEPGETAPTIESLWAEVREIRGLTADAAQDGLSATETGDNERKAQS